jgi:hypothetical protein
MFGQQYRKAKAQSFEKDIGRIADRLEAISEDNRRALHRLCGTEGLHRIDTRCPMCPTEQAIQAQCGYCNGSCHQDQHCPIQHSQTPSPIDPQPVQLRKTGLWTRFRSWLERHCIGWEQ